MDCRWKNVLQDREPSGRPQGHYCGLGTLHTQACRSREGKRVSPRSRRDRDLEELQILYSLSTDARDYRLRSAFYFTLHVDPDICLPLFILAIRSRVAL